MTAYRKHLVKAGYLQLDQLPERLHQPPADEKEKKDDGSKAAQKEAHSQQHIGRQQFSFGDDGEAQLTITRDDVMKRLGLQKDGIGEQVALKELWVLDNILADSQAGNTITSLKIKSFNLPEVWLNVSMETAGPKPTTVVKEYAVCVDDLVPWADSQAEKEEKDPLLKTEDHTSLTIPQPPAEEVLSHWAHAAIDSCMFAAGANNHGKLPTVEVVIVSKPETKPPQVTTYFSLPVFFRLGPQPRLRLIHT